MGGKYGTRNPYRDIDNKIDYSHLPYHKLKQIKEVTENNNQLLLLPAPNIEKNEEFCEAFDLEGYIYITAIISIIINNYFKNNNWDTNIKLFGSEVKYITAAESKAIVVRDANMVTLPENNTKAEEYTGEEDAYNNGLFDFFIDEHPITALIPINGAKNIIELYTNAPNANVWGPVKLKKTYSCGSTKANSQKNSCGSN